MTPTTIKDTDILEIEVYYSAGYSAETMKVIETTKYSGDVLSLSLDVWSDLRRFNHKMFTHDEGMTTGISMSIAGFVPGDPNLQLVRDNLYQYIQALQRRISKKSHLN